MIIKKQNDGIKNVITGYDFQAIGVPSAPQEHTQAQTQPQARVSTVNLNTNSKISSEQIKSERVSAQNHSFFISPIVSEHRGHKEQGQLEYEVQIQEIVQQKLNQLEDKWKKKGHEEGMVIGKQQIQNESQDLISLYSAEMISLIEGIKNVRKNIIIDQKNMLVEMVKQVSKWIILREIKTDDEYISRLFEKILYELDSKENLLIKVGKNQLNYLKEQLPYIQEKFSELKNVRIEFDNEIENTGIVIESPYGIIDGSLKSQFEHIDKLFAQMQESIE